ncbi:amidase, partial [Plectosphaerella plurivora]
MENVGFIRKAAWKNARFGSLRDICEHIRHTEPRHDPAVYPIEDSDVLESSTSSSPTDDGAGTDQVPAGPCAAATYRELYLTGELTPLDVARAILPLIRRDTNPPGEHSVAWIEVRPDLILEAAAASTRRYAEGRSLGPLDGVPTAVKDDYDMVGYKTTLGTCHNYAPDTVTNDDVCWCIRKLEETGAVNLGKLSLHEFGMDTAGYNIVYGTPRNPHNPSYYPGGSSTGSAYTVAAGLVPFSLGADGGGSIRLPASFCSVFGLKPTHGRVSFYPGQNLSGTAAVRGPLAVDMRSLIALYEVASAPDPRSDFPPSRPFRFSSDSKRPKILGLPEAWFSRADPAVQRLCRALIARLVKEKGYTVVPIDIPFVAEGQISHAITLLGDAASLLQDMKGISPANRILFALGRTTPAWDYLLAQKLRRVLMQHLAWLWEQHPGMILVTPTSASAGWPIRKEKELKYGISDGDQTMKTMEYVWMGNFCGVPSITVPAGFAPAEGKEADAPATVPVGLMGTGEWCSEESLLRFGLDAEEVGADIQRRPPNYVDVIALARARRAREHREDGDDAVSTSPILPPA